LTCSKQNELAIQKSAFERLREKSKIKVACNIPLLGRCVDMVCMRGQFLFTIEFKLHDWRRAIIQAIDHKLASDYAYICLPKRRNIEHLLPEFRYAGVGLLFFNEEGDWPFVRIVKAPRSDETWVTARANLLKQLMAQSGNWL
jgi:hypothetical protein